MRYQTIFFDLDGTLTDSGEGITNSVAYALRKQGLPVPDRRVLCRFIGPPLVEELQAFCGVCFDEAMEMAGWFREYFSNRGIFENRLYAGVPEMLERLYAGGCRLIVATSKPEPFAARILEHFGITHFFDQVAGSTMEETRTAKEEVLAYAMKRAGLPGGAAAVMVGDRRHDILGARKNGLEAIGVLYGYGSREELTAAGAAMLAETVPDVARLILD